MQRDPAQRFPSVRAFGVALLPYATDRARLLFESDFLDPATPGGIQPGIAGAPVAAASAPGVTTLGSSAGEVVIPGLPAKRSPLAWVGGALALVAVVGVGGWAVTRSRPGRDAGLAAAPTASAMPAAAALPPPSAASQPSVTPAIPQLVAKRVVTEPDGALITVDGKPLGKAPVAVEIPEGRDSVEVDLRAPGYVAEKRTVSRADQPEIRVKLKPVAARPAAEAAPPRRQAPVLAPR
jgi:hypothetical protein